METNLLRNCPFVADGCLFVNASLLEAFTTCPRKAFYGYVMGRRAAMPNPALLFGRHIHTALAYRYRMLAYGRRPSLDVLHRILTKRFEQEPFDDEWRTLETAAATITAYEDKYASEPISVAWHDGLPLVECRFAVNMGVVRGHHVFYTGRIDVVVQRQNEVFVMDHKTSSIVGPTFWEALAVSEQLRGYCYALRRVTGLDPLGYIANVIVNRKPSKTGVSLDLQRQAYYIQQPPGQLEEWEENLLAQCDRLLYCLETDSFPCHHCQCIGRFGRCEFYDVCSMPRELRSKLLASEMFIDAPPTTITKYKQ